MSTVLKFLWGTMVYLIKHNELCVDKLDLDSQCVNKSVNWGHSCNLLYNCEQHEEHLLWPSKLLYNINVGSRIECVNDKVNVVDHKKSMLNRSLQCQYSHVSVIDIYRRIQSNADSALSMSSSGNTSTKIPCNSINTGDGFLHTNNTNPYYHEQIPKTVTF